MTARTTAALRDVEMVNSLSGIFEPNGSSKSQCEPASFAAKVQGISREIWVKMAATHSEWEDALQLVSDNYRNRGYESADAGRLRLTPHHALPDTVVFIAKYQEEVIMTMTLVPDNCLLGLPMEILYGEEISQLRNDGNNLVEVTGLADKDLSLREFIPVFVATMQMLAQYAIYTGADIFSIAINPRHRRFYTSVMGFESFGPLRQYPFVRNHPAEAYMAGVATVKENAPSMHEKLFRHWFDPDDLATYPIPPEFIRDFSQRSSQTSVEEVDRILKWTENFGSSRRW